MANFNKSNIQHIALLSNLNLTDQEFEKFTPQLSKIVEFIGMLSEVNTDNVEPTTQITGLKNVLRKDKIDVSKIMTANDALSGTDKVHNDLIMVPVVLEGREI